MTWKLLTLVLAIALAACGGDDSPPTGNPDAATIDSSLHDDDATSADAGPTVDADGDATTDGPPPSAPGVTCGATSCPTDQVCCVTTGRDASQTCQTAEACETAGGTGFACDSAA